MKTHIIYHAHCSDGLMAAAVAGQAASEGGAVPVYHAANYGDAPPELPKDAAVIIVDFSYPADTLAALAQSVRSVTVLDHHASAIERLRGWSSMPNVTLILDSSRSGAMLAWDYFFAEQLAPLAVRLVQDRDLWQWKLEHTKAFSFGLSALPRDSPDSWRALLASDSVAKRLIADGSAIEAYYNEHLASTVQQATPCRLHGVDGYAVNASRLFASEAGNALAQLPGSSFGLVWLAHGGEVYMSFRSTDGRTARALAESFGGGGHGNAAGCTLKVQEFLEATGAI